jgi:hypothetical protein
MPQNSPEHHMIAKAVTPIWIVSNFAESVVWFEKLGWTKGLKWGEPPTFGAICSGEFEKFLCQSAQGGRGNGEVKATFGPDGDSAADEGFWMSVLVEDVDAFHSHCVDQGLDVAWPPTDMQWGVRKMHVRHPDGHVFKISKGLGAE